MKRRAAVESASSALLILLALESKAAPASCLSQAPRARRSTPPADAPHAARSFVRRACIAQVRMMPRAQGGGMRRQPELQQCADAPALRQKLVRPQLLHSQHAQRSGRCMSMLLLMLLMMLIPIHTLLLLILMLLLMMLLLLLLLPMLMLSAVAADDAAAAAGAAALFSRCCCCCC